MKEPGRPRVKHTPAKRAPKTGPGKPRLFTVEEPVRSSVLLDRRDYEWAIAHGGGQFSRGVRRLIAAARGRQPE